MADFSMPDSQQAVIGGIEGHTDFGVVAALDPLGRVLGTESFPATGAGYCSAHAWLASFGPIAAVGVESTGSFGAALTRSLVERGCGVIEVNQPHPHLRSRRAKNDAIDAEAAELGRRLDRLVATAAPTTLSCLGCGTHHTATLLVAAGHNIDRFGSEASVAHLCAAAPVPASSGRTERHRLNFAPNRDANRALHMIVIVRLRYCERTRSYTERRLAEGKTKKEAIRCLKRFVAVGRSLVIVVRRCRCRNSVAQPPP